MSISNYYTHLDKSTKKCTMCENAELIRLPEEFQIYSRKKNYESYFCSNCVQVVNFYNRD